MCKHGCHRLIHQTWPCCALTQYPNSSMMDTLLWARLLVPVPWHFRRQASMVRTLLRILALSCCQLHDASPDHRLSDSCVLAVVEVQLVQLLRQLGQGQGAAHKALCHLFAA